MIAMYMYTDENAHCAQSAKFAINYSVYYDLDISVFDTIIISALWILV